MKRSIKRIKSVVFIVRQTCTGRRVFSLCYYFEMPFFIFNLLSSMPGIKLVPRILYPLAVWWNPLSLHQQLMKDSKFGLTFWLNLHSPHWSKNSRNSLTDWYLPPFSQQMKSTWCWSSPVIPEEAAETKWCAVNAVSTCQNTFNFFSYLVIFRHYFTGTERWVVY